jgi:hypothetical protein
MTISSGARNSALLSDVVSMLTQDGWGISPGPHTTRAVTGADTLQYFDRDKANRFPRILKFAVNSLLKFNLDGSAFLAELRWRYAVHPESP